MLVRAKIAFVLATLLGAAGLTLAAPVNAAAPADPNVRFEQHILAKEFAHLHECTRRRRLGIDIPISYISDSLDLRHVGDLDPEVFE